MPTLGLAMIVKNEAHTIRACLESARDFVSQIVVADTGCSDDTCDIAREFGATVVPFPWVDHFAKARNAALEPIRTDWVLVLDADEELDQKTARNLPRLFNAGRMGGYKTPIRNYVKSKSNRGWDRIAIENDGTHPRARNAPAMFVHENCRIFRRRPDIFFRGRVHELVEPQIAAAGLELGKANFFIHHFGHLESNEEKSEKGSYYQHLLRLRVEDEPDNPDAWVHLGLQEYEHAKNYDEALRCFENALRLEPRAAEAWLFLSMIYVDLGKYQEALNVLQHDTRTGAGVALREQIRGDALHGLHQFDAARQAYLKSMRAGGRDPGVESKLGYVEIKLGKMESGFARLTHAAQEVPGMFAIQDRLMKAYVITGKLGEAAQVACEFAPQSTHPKMFLRAASLCGSAQDWPKCVEILKLGLRRFPESCELRQALAEADGYCGQRKPDGTEVKELQIASDSSGASK